MRTLDMAVRIGLLLVIAFSIAACAERTTMPSDDAVAFSGLVSDPVAAGAITASGSSPSITYVSMSPGTMDSGVMATIRNARTGASIGTPLASGGFDPVALSAEAGDTLEIAVGMTSGGMHHAKRAVPVRIRPRVVRTSPARGRLDVAINTSVIIVFSEPITPGSRDTVHIRVRAGTASIPGEVRGVAGSPVAVEWVPQAALAAGTAYELVLSETITDLSGDPIEGPLTVPFQTAAAIPDQPPGPPPSPLPANPDAEVIAFSRNGDIYVMQADGSGSRQVTSGAGDDLDPVWSPDGSRIAFTRYYPGFDAPGNEEAAIYVIDTDGSGLVRLSPAEPDIRDREPNWHPDGSRLAFARRTSAAGEPWTNDIFSINADGTNPVRITVQGTASHPSWSPDGSRLAYNVWNWQTFRLNLRVMNADGSGTITIPVPPGGATWSAAWSPDGSRILALVLTCLRMEITTVNGVASCVESAGPYLTAFDPDGTNVQRLSDYPVLTELWNPPPTWSPDGQVIAFTEAACDVEMVVYPCQEPTRVRLLRLSDGVISTLAQGSAPNWRR